jgi:hypothetical protein
MEPSTHHLEFNGGILQRGFWLYIWEITPPTGPAFHYVGRTGDSSSFNAQSPFNRMGQHLGFNVNSNVLRRRLESQQVQPEKCTYRLVSHGPIFSESKDPVEYKRLVGLVAALERDLAKALKAAGYPVLNTVSSNAVGDSGLLASVIAGFSHHFPALRLPVQPVLT